MLPIEPSDQPQTVVTHSDRGNQNKADNTQTSQQSQKLLPQDRSGPLQGILLQEEAKVKGQVNNASQSKPKRPFDPLPWFYRLLFILVVPGVAFWMAHKPVPLVSLPLLNHAVPAYHVITVSEISMRLVDQSNVTNDTERKTQDLIGHYTLVTIQADQPIHQSQIGLSPDPSLITKTLAVAIPANSLTILGGNLHAGDIVKIAAVPLSATTSSPILVFDKVLVLDVKSVGSGSVIILAIPADRWIEYLAKTRNATVVLARQIG